MNSSHCRLWQRGAAAWQIILGILAVLVVLALLVALAAGVIVSRYVEIDVKKGDAGERIEISSPVGELAVEKGVDVAERLRLPVYPGAEEEDEGVSVRLWGRVEDEEGGLDVLAAEFLTPDPVDRVDDWYREQLGPEFTREKGRIVGEGEAGREEHGWEIRVEPDGDDILYKHKVGDNRVRAVLIKGEDGRTKIGLFEIGEARHQ